MEKNYKESEIFCINKPLGLTPVQAISEFKKHNKKYQNTPISHAGKLDPLAEGVLLLITYPNKPLLKKFMRLDKQYKARILFGFSTDSFDVQGIPSKSPNPSVDLDKLKTTINDYKNEYLQETPPFSGRKVNGKPLFYFARMGKLSEIEIPKIKVIIKNISLDKIKNISGKELLKEITKKIYLLEGDFRQKDILKKWTEILKNESNTIYVLSEVTIDCSSGTYIREIANSLGKKMDSKGILFELFRTKVGKFKLSDCRR